MEIGIVGEFSWRAPILRNAAQQIEPGFGLCIRYSIDGFYLLTKLSI